MTDKLDWLLQRADRLRKGHRRAVDVANILKQLGVEVRTIPSTSGTGVLSKSEDGHYIVTVKQPDRALLWRPRDRFTAAHELAHILLIEKWDFCPTSDQRKDYFFCEQLCNRFAARLLVDPRIVAETDCSSAQTALDSLLKLSKECEVSREVAARELIAHHNGLAFALVEYVENGVSPFKIIWGVSSLVDVSVTKNRNAYGESPSEACYNWCNESFKSSLEANRLDAAERNLSSFSHIVGVVATLREDRYEK